MALSNVVAPPITDTEHLAILVNHAVSHNLSVVAWKLPHDNVTNVIVSSSAALLDPTQRIEGQKPGFIFAPFDASRDRYFLPAEYCFSFSNGCLNQPTSPKEIASTAWLNDLLNAKDTHIKQPAVYINPKAASTPDSTKDFFLNLVGLGVTNIENGRFEKVVLSRVKVVDVPSFDVIEGFQKLTGLYPTALISFVSIPETGSWLGATPEVLVSVKDQKIFRTTALAGTQPFWEGTNLKTVAWTQKDIEEQALVERYIISCFKKIRLREYDEHGPRTVVAGNLMHLKSDFTVDMEATNFPQLGSVMLQLLHPTSAVCGVPLDTALEFISKNENYDRQFYTGYLGPVNFNNSTDIFVNLRCLQVLHGKVILYAGAGITQDSVPENEWEETELKLQTLLKIIE